MNKQEKQYIKGAMMTAEQISIEIFGGEITPRVISERHSYRKGYPETYQEGVNGKKFWRRSEIYAFYKVSELDKAA